VVFLGAFQSVTCISARTHRWCLAVIPETPAAGDNTRAPLSPAPSDNFTPAPNDALGLNPNKVSSWSIAGIFFPAFRVDLYRGSDSCFSACFLAVFFFFEGCILMWTSFFMRRWGGTEPNHLPKRGREFSIQYVYRKIRNQTTHPPP